MDYPGLPDNIYAYENQFDYAVWTPNTEVLACSVPWDASYRDVVRFDTEDARDEYFAQLRQYGFTFNITGMVYLRQNEPIRVNAPFSIMNNANYLVVKNKIQPVPPENSQWRKPDVFYYFIKDVTYIAPNTTQLNIQLDVWQTYIMGLSFGLCYVNKGHIGIANENSTLYNMSQYLCEPEGLNIGDEYDVVAIHSTSWQNLQPWIVIQSSAKLDADFGDTNNPVLVTADGSTPGGMISGCEVYCCKASDFLKLMDALKNAPWVSQCITGLTIVPYEAVAPGTLHSFHGASFYELNANASPMPLDFDNVFRRFALHATRYKNVLKMYTSPFCMFEATSYTGGELVLKPECMAVSKDDKTRFMEQVSTAAPDMRITIRPYGYNAMIEAQENLTATVAQILTADMDAVLPSGQTITAKEENAEYLDMALTVDSFPQFPIVNDMYQYYMASTARTRAYAWQAADWSYQKSLAGANLAYNQSINTMQTGLSNTQVANQARSDIAYAANQQSGVNLAANLLGGAAGIAAGAATKNVAIAGTVASAAASGLSDAVKTVSGMNTNVAQTNIQNASAMQQAQNTAANQQYQADTNLAYANFAAKGDYENAIAQIQAKVQDARVTQPSTSGQNGGQSFIAAIGKWGWTLKWKRMKRDYIMMVGDFFLRYGYTINRWITPPKDLKCMENFTYWKMQSTYVFGTAPESFKDAIRGILESGVTVWSDPGKIGRVDLADNEPLKGIRY